MASRTSCALFSNLYPNLFPNLYPSFLTTNRGHDFLFEIKRNLDIVLALVKFGREAPGAKASTSCLRQMPDL